jgi:hypothetical protein
VLVGCIEDIQVPNPNDDETDRGTKHHTLKENISANTQCCIHIEMPT